MAEELKRIEIVWLDATSFSNEWLNLEEIKKLEPDVYTTIGILIDQTDDVIIVAQSQGKVGFYNIFKIPQGSIISKRVLSLLW